ncbi:hypothetical protein [Glaciimonas soli]|uniref:Uncharacterized protein n=1 Tax=Glaciimonas soli TaxID=2590999 RepID=A0A843YX87_9BURK|nr:hypothetical protein [Glaciimonas soli]MQR02343.1 hypothetical protein [Glaciimonas soli]
MSISFSEAMNIITNMRHLHSGAALNIAHMQHFCHHVLTHYGQLYRTPVQNNLNLLDQCIDSHLTTIGINSQELDDAKQALQQASEALQAIDPKQI